MGIDDTWLSGRNQEPKRKRVVAVILVGEPGCSDKAGSSRGQGRTWQDLGFVVKLEQ